MTGISPNRRKVLAAALGCAAFFEQSGAWALSPPAPPPPTLADHIANSDLVFVGVIERFVFRGHDLSTHRGEFGRDFPENNEAGNRSMDAFVRLKTILKNALDFDVPKILRVQQPVPPENRAAHLGIEQIFFVKEGNLLKGVNPDDQLFRVFWSVIDARSIKQKRAVLDIIVQQKKSTKP